MRKKIKKNDPGHPDICAYMLSIRFSEETHQETYEVCKTGGLGCVQCKKALSENVIRYMAPMYERRQKLIGNKQIILDVLREGNRHAREVARETIEEVREKMKLMELE